MPLKAPRPIPCRADWTLEDVLRHAEDVTRWAGYIRLARLYDNPQMRSLTVAELMDVIEETAAGDHEAYVAFVNVHGLHGRDPLMAGRSLEVTLQLLPGSLRARLAKLHRLIRSELLSRWAAHQVAPTGNRPTHGASEHLEEWRLA